MTIREFVTKWVFKGDLTPVQKFETGIGRIKHVAATAAKGLGVVAATTAGLGLGLAKLTAHVAESLDKFDKLSARTGVSAETLQQLKHAADLSDVNMEALPMALRTLAGQATMATKGNKEATASFRSLGVSLKDSSGQARSADDLFMATIGALADMEEGSKRTYLGSKLLGRGWVEMLPMLQGGRFALAEAMGEARKLGLVQSNEAVKGAANFNDELSRLKATVTGLAANLAVELFPVFRETVTQIKDWVTANRGLIAQKLHEVAKKFAEALRELMAAAQKHDLFGKLTWAIKASVDVMSLMLKHGTAVKYMFMALIGLSVASKLAPLLSLFGGLVGHLRAITKLGPSVAQALNPGGAAGGGGLGGKLGVLGLVGAAGSAGYAAGTWLDEKFGLSDKISDKLASLHRESKGSIDKRYNLAGLREQAQMYAGMLARGMTSVGVEGGQRMALSRENILARLAQQADRLGISRADQASLLPAELARAGIKGNVVTNTVAPTINVQVQPGTPEKVAKQIATQTGAITTKQLRQTMATVTAK